MSVSMSKCEHMINNDMELPIEDTNTCESTYVFDVHINKFNPNKISTNTFLYKLNRRMHEMDGHHDIESRIKSNDRMRWYNTK